MLNKKEITAILITSLILGFVLTLIETTKLFLYSSLTILIILLINISTKKITSFYLDSEIEVSLWEIKRYGIKPRQKLKRPFPAGAFIPIISKIIFVPFNNFVWMASLVFDAKPKIYRAARRHGLYSFSEITEFAKLNIYFAFFNLIPISNLDGNKIFFGNTVLWSFLATITLIALGYVFFLI